MRAMVTASQVPTAAIRHKDCNESCCVPLSCLRTCWCALVLHNLASKPLPKHPLQQRGAPADICQLLAAAAQCSQVPKVWPHVLHNTLPCIACKVVEGVIPVCCCCNSHQSQVSPRTLQLSKSSMVVVFKLSVCFCLCVAGLLSLSELEQGAEGHLQVRHPRGFVNKTCFSEALSQAFTCRYDCLVH